MLKIIDLLQLIADRKEIPKIIKYRDKIWIYDEKNQDYFKDGKDDYDLFGYAFCNWRTLDFINDLVEKVED